MDNEKMTQYESMAKLNLEGDVRDWTINAINTLEDSFKTLADIDTENIEPLVSVLALDNVLRADISEKFITRDELLSNAPEEYDGYFEVPKTLE